MSYCRWSSDNWTCDLYCYEDVEGGYVTFVADNRIVGKVPEAPIILLLNGETDKWGKLYREQMQFIENAERKPIGLPYDGQTFNDPTLEKLLERLLDLRAIGYNFSDTIINRVKEDIRIRDESSGSRL